MTNAKTTENLECEGLDDIEGILAREDVVENDKPLSLTHARARLIREMENGIPDMTRVRAAIKEIGPHLKTLRPEIERADNQTRLIIHDVRHDKYYVFRCELYQTDQVAHSKRFGEIEVQMLRYAALLGIDEDLIIDAIETCLETLDADGEWETMSALMSEMTRAPELLAMERIDELRTYRFKRADPAGAEA